MRGGVCVGDIGLDTSCPHYFFPKINVSQPFCVIWVSFGVNEHQNQVTKKQQQQKQQRTSLI